MGFVKKGKGQKKKSSSGNKDKHRDRARDTADNEAFGANNRLLQHPNAASGGGGFLSLPQEANGNGNERDNLGNLQLLEAHGSVERATPFWVTLSREERKRMLSVPLNDLRKELEIHIATQRQQQQQQQANPAPAPSSSSSLEDDGNGNGSANGSNDQSQQQASASSTEEDQQAILEGPAYLKVELDRGLGRLKEHGTWKAWIAWEGLRPQTHNLEGEELRGTTPHPTSSSSTDGDDAAAATTSPPPSPVLTEFYDGDEFRQYLQSCYPKELLDMLLERDWNSKLEFDAETQLRLRMQELLQLVNNKNVHCSPNNLVGGVGAGGAGGAGAGNGIGNNGNKDSKNHNSGGLQNGGDATSGRHHQERVEMPSQDLGTGSNRRLRLRSRYNSRTDHQLNIRNNQVELITLMLEALDQEHELLYHAFLFPVTEFVCEKLDANNRESSREELFFEDLEKLSVADVGKICEFLTEKIDGLSSRMKSGDSETEENENANAKNGSPSAVVNNSADSEEGTEEGMGDVDLFQLNEEDKDKEAKSSKGEPAEALLVVNPKWLQHLEERCLSEDGHPTKVTEGQDPDRVGLVLDWVYGSIVSTAEKSRDAAWKQLGRSPPDVVLVYETFLKGLLEQYLLEKKRKKAKCYLEEMVRSRKLNQELAEQVMEMQQEQMEANKMVSTNPSEDLSDFLPDHIIHEMLKREKLLTDSKLYALRFEQESCEKKLTGIKAQLRQAEPEFERIKRELAEMKSNPKVANGANGSGGDGTYRSQAEMERHRAQLQDAAIEEQLEVQTGYREQGMQLKVLYGKRQQCEIEMNQNDTQIKQLSTWKRTIEDMTERFGKILEEQRESKEQRRQHQDGLSNTPTAAGNNNNSNNKSSKLSLSTPEDIEQAGGTHEKLRAHFHKEIRRQLYTEKDDRQFFDRIKTVLLDLEKRIDAGCAALSHMETIIVNLACDDPGAVIGSNLLLPRHQRNIDLGAQKHMQQKAKEAEDEILRLEVEAELKKSQERERKQKKRNKQKEEKRLRLQAEKKAKEDALQKTRELELKQKQEEEEKVLMEKQRRQAELELRRKMEEEVIERRRAELEAEVSMQLSADNQSQSNSEAEAGSAKQAKKKKNPEGQDQESDGFIVVEKRLKSYNKDKNDHQKKGAAKHQKNRKHQNGKANNANNSQAHQLQPHQAPSQAQSQAQSHRRVAGDEPALPRPTGIKGVGPPQHQQKPIQNPSKQQQQKATNTFKAPTDTSTASVGEKKKEGGEQMPERRRDSTEEGSKVQVMKSVQVGTDEKEEDILALDGGDANQSNNTNVRHVMDGEQDHMTDAIQQQQHQQQHLHAVPSPQIHAPPLMPGMPPLGMQPGLPYYSQPFPVPGYMEGPPPPVPHPGAVPHMMPYGLPPPPVDPMNPAAGLMQPNMMQHGNMMPMAGSLPPPPYVTNGNMNMNIPPHGGFSPPQMIGVMPGQLHDPSVTMAAPPVAGNFQQGHLSKEAREMLMNVNAQPFVPPKKQTKQEQLPATAVAAATDMKEKKGKKGRNARKGSRKTGGGSGSGSGAASGGEEAAATAKSSSNDTTQVSPPAVKESKTCPCGLVDGPCV
jgi:hypothetical protein